MCVRWGAEGRGRGFPVQGEWQNCPNSGSQIFRGLGMLRKHLHPQIGQERRVGIPPQAKLEPDNVISWQFLVKIWNLMNTKISQELMVAQSGQRLAMGEQIRETVNMMAVLDSNSCVSSHTTVIKQVVQEKRVC